MKIVRLAFPIVCLLTQTNALILDLEVRLCKLLIVKHTDSRAAGIKNTWINWKILTHFKNEILLYELMWCSLEEWLLYPVAGLSQTQVNNIPKVCL